jgi:hypothetical protein
LSETPSGPTPNWEIPPQYGYAAAIEGMGSVASPFLAGIGMALVTLVLSSQNSFARPSLALLLLVGATLAFIGAVQCSFWARCFLVSPGELAEWWGDDLKDPERLRKVEAEQRSATKQHATWALRSSWFYNGGIALLLLALPVLLIPPGGLAGASTARTATFVLAVVGFVAEALWIAESQAGVFSRLKKPAS